MTHLLYSWLVALGASLRGNNAMPVVSTGFGIPSSTFGDTWIGRSCSRNRKRKKRAAFLSIRR